MTLSGFSKGTGIVLLIFICAAAAAKDYENFELPRSSAHRVAVDSPLNYINDRLTLKGKGSHLKITSVDAKELLFAKEFFLAEKRDEAIKLLRQEMDSGLKANRDNMLLRLGQLYAEKYMELSFREQELYTHELAQFEKNKSAHKKAKPPVLDSSRSQQYLKDSLALFYQLEKEYPKTPKIDEVIFFIGFVEMELGHNDKGVSYLERVIHHYPRSRKFEEAVVYLGDYYFDKTKFAAAQAKFRILLNRHESPLYDYAKYKLAWCELNLGEQRKGLNDMKAVVADLQGTQDKAKFNLREQALKDLVIFFGEVEAVDEATRYFTELLGREKALDNLKLIADILRSKARDESAVRAYRRLIAEFPDSLEAPQMELGIYECLTRLGKTNQAVTEMVHTIERYGQASEWAKSFPQEKQKELNQVLNTLQAEAEKNALLIHQSAQKSANKGAYNEALRLYTALLNGFPNHPSRKNISFYRADILFDQGKWLEASDAYMQAAKVPPKDKRTEEAVYGALESLDRLIAASSTIQRYTKEQQEKVSTAPEEIPTAEQRFIEASEFFVKEYPRGQRVVDVKFRVAAIYYRRHHFDEALARFNDIALKNPKHRSAMTAAHIVLDIYNIKKDYDKLAEAAANFAAQPGLGDATFKAELNEIIAEVGFKRIEKLEAQNKWNEAAEAYLKVYKANPTGPLAEKSLYNAFISFDKANDVVHSQEVSRLFIAKFPKSQYTQRLMLGLASTAEKSYDFAGAERLYVDFWRKYPKEKDARKALYNAAVFAELLEMNKEAVSLYNEYLKDRSTTPEEKRAIQVSLAKLYRKQGDLDKMTLIYRRLARDAKSQNEKLSLLGELAHQYEILGKTAEKEALIKEMRWLHGAAPDAKLTGLGAYYVAEAEFRALVPKRQKYDDIKLRFPPEDLLYLLKRKEKLLSRLGEAYDKVVEVGVPDWGVAALFEKSDAYDNFVKSYRSVQVPKHYKAELKAETEKALKAIDDKLVKPLEAKGQQFAKACVDRAAQFHVTNEYALKCRARLKNDASLDVKGLLPQPTYWSVRPPAGETKESDGKSADSADSSKLEALVLGAAEKPAQVERNLKAYLAAHPKDSRAVFLLAAHYMRMNRKEIANHLFNRLEKDATFPWKSMLYNDEALMALRDHNRTLALSYFEKAVETEPVTAAAQVNLGALYLESRSWSDAEKLFSSAHQSDPTLEDAALGLGVSLEAQGKYEEAHKVYSEYMDKSPGAMSVLYNDSIVLGNHLKRREEAAQLMLRYIQNGGKETAKAHEIIQTWR